MKILVTGSRTWGNRLAIRRELATFPPRTIVVHGANGYRDEQGRVIRGADLLADEIARVLGFSTRTYPADWKKFGMGAGPVRNAEMLAREHPDAEGIPIRMVLAFSKLFTKDFAPGTSNMIERAERVKIPVRRVSE